MWHDSVFPTPPLRSHAFGAAPLLLLLALALTFALSACRTVPTSATAPC